MTAVMVAHDCRNRGDAVEQLTIQPVKKISGTVKLPGSKSLSNRILLLAALAEGTTVVRNLLVGWGLLNNMGGVQTTKLPVDIHPTNQEAACEGSNCKSICCSRLCYR